MYFIRTLLSVSLVMVLLFVPSSCTSTKPSSTEPTSAEPNSTKKKPNIVFILCDDLGYGEIQSLAPKTSKIKTPHVDQLTREGMVFTDAHSGSAVCTPTRYGILTGRYSWRTKLQSGVVQGFAPNLILENRPTIGNFLEDQGYNTALIGKWHLNFQYLDPASGTAISKKSKKQLPPVGATIPDGPMHRGFDYFHGFHHAKDMKAVIENDKVILHEDEINMLPRLTNKSVAYINDQAKNKDGKPFFLYVPLGSPHTPILPTKEWQGKSGLGDYADFVMQTDATVGAITKALKENGLSENTIVIFSSDNGTSKAADIEALAAKGHIVSAGYRGSKSDLWDGGHRVPFIVKWPGVVKPGSTSDELICLTDVLATFSEITNQPVPSDSGEDSVSFLSALKGEKINSTRAGVIHHSITGHFAYRLGKWKLLLAKGSGGWSSPREKESSDMPIAQLYNLETDPAETQNLYETNPEIAEKLLQQLELDIETGRSTKGAFSKNDVDNIILWKNNKNKKSKNKKANKRGANKVESTKVESNKTEPKKIQPNKTKSNKIGSSTSSSTQKRPNIIFLLSDDQATVATGCYGNDQVLTPNMDNLAEEGVLFENHYNTTAICAASRAIILTGMYEYKTGCNFDHGPLKKEKFAKSYPVLLREQGYYTGFAGKFGFAVADGNSMKHNSYDRLPVDDFDNWAGGLGQTSYRTAKNKYMAKYAEAYPHSTRAYAAWAEDFIVEAKETDKPFCMSISFKAPHMPFSPDKYFDYVYEGKTYKKPENYGAENATHLAPQARTGRQYRSYDFWRDSEESYQKTIKDYNQLIHGVDYALGMIRKTLEEQGVAENTIIIFTSDNGYSCGAHNFGGKVLPYEEASKSPLIIYDPRTPANERGIRREKITANIDMAPTILNYAGVPAPENMDGEDLGLLINEPKKFKRETVTLTNMWGNDEIQAMGVVSQDWKYIFWQYEDENMKPTEELYHIGKDPLEMTNKAKDPSAKKQLEKMRALYDLQLDEIRKEGTKDNLYKKYDVLFDRNATAEDKKPYLIGTYDESLEKGKGKKKKGKKKKNRKN